MAAACSLDRVLQSPNLPSVPSVALRLLELTRDLDSSTKDIVTTIKSDPALAVKILKSANSSYFGFRSEIKTLEQAVPVIGRTVITSLALSFSLSQEAVQEGPLKEHYRRYWLKSLVIASAAERLPQHGPSGLSSELFLAGLLIDIGQLAMLKVLRSEYVALLNEALETGRSDYEIERERLNFDHAVVGAELMRRWKLPESLCRAAGSHHENLDTLTDQGESDPLAESLIVSSAVGDYFCSPQTAEALKRLQQISNQLYGFTADELNDYLEKVDERIKQTGELLNTSTDDLLSPADLMAQAMEQLAEISIQADIQKRQADSLTQQAEEEKRKLLDQNEKLQEQVFRDPLTGLYNRRFFDEALEHEVNRAARNGSVLGILFLDVDHFKRLNDSQGHQFGDTVLMRIGEILPNCIRTSDIAARYGGEEFVILAIDTSEAGLKTLAERIRQAIEGEYFQNGVQVVPVTASVGGVVAIPRADEVDLAHRLVESADAAMYESKRRGRNCITLQSLASDFERRVSQLAVEHRFSHWLAKNKMINLIAAHELVQQSRPESSHIGELALKRGWLDQASVQQVLEAQKSARERFGTVACRLGLLTDVQLACLLADQAEDADVLVKSLAECQYGQKHELDLLLDCFRQECRRHIEKSRLERPQVTSPV
ncbi:HDOD domain-containing protein [bacterium]|nr:HDOD domain-containing protein [bacterium]